MFNQYGIENNHLCQYFDECNPTEPCPIGGVVACSLWHNFNKQYRWDDPASITQYSPREELSVIRPRYKGEHPLTPVSLDMLDNFRQWGPMPPEAIALGVAYDGLPMLLNLHDPVPGPVLFVGDPVSGKTHLLHSAAVGIALQHHPEHVNMHVISENRDEWQAFTRLPHLPFLPAQPGSSDAASLLGNLSRDIRDRATASPHLYRGPQSVLFIDNIALLARSIAQHGHDFSWRHLLQILEFGPTYGVWPIVAGTTIDLEPLEYLSRYFRTRLFTQITRSLVSARLRGPHADSDQINPLTYEYVFGVYSPYLHRTVWYPAHGFELPGLDDVIINAEPEDIPPILTPPSFRYLR